MGDRFTAVTLGEGFDPSTGYKLFVPGAQDTGSGAAIDRSPNGNDLLIDADTTSGAVWANSGYITSTGTYGDSGNKGVTSETAIPLDFSSQTILLALTVNAAAADGAFDFDGKNWIGNFNNVTGLGLKVTNTSGKFGWHFKQGSALNYDSGGYGPKSSTITVFDGTDHNIVFYWNGATTTLNAYVDGVLDTNFSNLNLGAIPALNGITSSFSVGSSPSYSGNGNRGVKVKNLHLLTWEKTAAPSVSQVLSVVSNFQTKSFANNPIPNFVLP